MNHTSFDGVEYVEAFEPLVADVEGVEIVLCPSFVAISSVAAALEESAIATGAQDLFWMPSGAFTSCISVEMLEAEGVEFVIIGHSERRARFGVLEIPTSTVGYFGETDETVNLKLLAVQPSSLIPILCVGETLGERNEGKTDAVIREQLAGALEGIDLWDRLVVAYEPVWAIGTGQTCDTAEAERVCGMIRRTLGELSSPDLAETVRILYGGSVKPANAADLFAQPNIDGGLVGGASLKPEDFAAVVRGALA